MFLNIFTKQDESLAYKQEKTSEIEDKLNNEINTISKESTTETGVNSAEAVEAEPKKETDQSPPAEKSLISPATRADQKPTKDNDKM